MIINMCITPSNVLDTKRPKAMATATGPDAPRAEERCLGASPKVRMLYENLCFLLENRKVYLDKGISLIRLSHMLYTNTTYLSRVINKYFGCNLKALLNRYRVQHAQELLEKKDCSMEELPARCGFSSRSAFYNAFVKFAHMTPTDYQATLRTQALRAGAELEG